MSEELTLADARKKYADATLNTVFALVSDPGRWLVVRPSEQQQRVIESRPGEGVRWSSLWPAAPNDTILIDLVAVGEATAQRAAGTGTELRFRWVTDSPPDERGVGLVRYRLNYIFGSSFAVGSSSPSGCADTPSGTCRCCPLGQASTLNRSDATFRY